MSVGFPQNKVDIDARAGSLAVQVRDMLSSIQVFQAFLSGKTSADLVKLGYTDGTSGTVDEVTLLKSAYTQLDQLRLVAIGQGTVTAANNFLFFSDQITGVL